jgi:hypothetical protein
LTRMSGWIDSSSKGSMEYFAAGRRQEREDTSLVIGQGVLFDEAGLAYKCNSS